MKKMQQSQSWPINSNVATISSEGQAPFDAQGQPRAAVDPKVKHKAGIALPQGAGPGNDVPLVQQPNAGWSLPKSKPWLEQVCNQLSDLRRDQRQRELAAGPPIASEHHSENS